MLGTATAVVDAAWANIYLRGDYCMPHSHTRATASLVYCVDPGEEDPDDPVGGRLFIADPRLAGCCRPVPSYMTSPIIPTMRPGTLLIFPAQVVHAVNPYNGERPRITLSWNIGAKAVPRSRRPPIRTGARKPTRHRQRCLRARQPQSVRLYSPVGISGRQTHGRTRSGGT